MSIAVGNRSHHVLKIYSDHLSRVVQVELYLPPGFDPAGKYPLLILNDGQDMLRLGMARMLEVLYRANAISPVVVAAIHAGDRLHEYGTVNELDYMKRGSKAANYVQFLIEQLLPLIQSATGISVFTHKAFGGFSLGGLSALDIVWHYPHLFSICGVFSGSLWWRKKKFNPKFPDSYRIIHDLIDNTQYRKGLRFWFQCGTEDEKEDRNNNGIIDSIDDTLDLISILEAKGYKKPHELHYYEIEGGTHDVYTWGKAMPEFLKWAFPPLK